MQSGSNLWQRPGRSEARRVRGFEGRSIVYLCSDQIAIKPQTVSYQMFGWHHAFALLRLCLIRLHFSLRQ